MKVGLQMRPSPIEFCPHDKINYMNDVKADYFY